MIHFDEYYVLSANEVECIESTVNERANCPYGLTVHFKSGHHHSVYYKDNGARELMKEKLVQEIERELLRDTERTQHELYIIRENVKRIDKRQLKIWKQLRNLLDVFNEEVDNDTELS